MLVIFIKNKHNNQELNVYVSVQEISASLYADKKHRALHQEQQCNLFDSSSIPKC